MLPYSADTTYRLEDLHNWDFPGTSLAVLGKPVHHSISPRMHNAAIARLSSEFPKYLDWKYFRFEIDPAELVSALPVFHAKGFAGLNLTVPHKEIAFPAIAAVDPSAQVIGAVNTLVRTEEGYRGYNTDGYGLEKGIALDLNRKLADAEVVLLGAGGAARAAAVQILQSGCKRLTIINRNQERLAGLVTAIKPLASKLGCELKSGSAEDFPHLPANCLLINATSLGLKDTDPAPIPETSLPQECDVYDMIYNPPQTRLMSQVIAKGGRASNGLSMLVHQGAKSLEIWTEKNAPAAIMNEAARSALV